MRTTVLVLCLLLLAGIASAQSTTVSATITDAAGQTWNNGTYALTFQVSPSKPTSQYYWNGAPFSKAQTIAGTMDGTGHFSVSVPSNTSITPSGSTWVIEVCPIAKGNTPCYSTHGITITGATQNISGLVVPPAISIDLAHPAYPFVVAYTNTEITTAPVGGIYWDYTQSHYFVCQTTNGAQIWYGACTLWKEICLVGDGLCGGGGTGCTLSGVDTGVLTEHPLGTCFDSIDFTWDDGASKQNMKAGLSNTAGSIAQLTFQQGQS